MSVRKNIVIAVGAGAVAVGVVAATAAASAAPAAVVNHTIKLVATQTASHQLSKTTAVAAETDRSHGKVIGYDILSEKFGRTSGLILGSFATQGGQIYFRVPFTNTKTLHGKVTGGSGKFAGINGTIAATSLNKAGTKTAVTIVYHH
jgi:hypothetical protein